MIVAHVDNSDWLGLIVDQKLNIKGGIIGHLIRLIWRDTQM